MALQNFPAFFQLKKCFCKIFQHLFYNIDRDEIRITPWQALKNLCADYYVYIIMSISTNIGQDGGGTERLKFLDVVCDYSPDAEVFIMIDPYCGVGIVGRYQLDVTFVLVAQV